MCLITPKQKVLRPHQEFPAWEEMAQGTGRGTEEGSGTRTSRTGQWFVEGPWVVICLLHLSDTCPRRPAGSGQRMWAQRFTEQ